MEGVEFNMELSVALRDLLLDISVAKNLVDDGKEVKCSRRLQGALAKCRNLCFYVQENEIVAKPDSKEQAGT